MWSKYNERSNRLLAVTAFPLKCVSLARRPMERRASASLWQTCSDTVLPRRAEIESRWSGVAKQSPDERTPLQSQPNFNARQFVAVSLSSLNKDLRHYWLGRRIGARTLSLLFSRRNFVHIAKVYLWTWHRMPFPLFVFSFLR